MVINSDVLAFDSVMLLCCCLCLRGVDSRQLVCIVKMFFVIKTLGCPVTCPVNVCVFSRLLVDGCSAEATILSASCPRCTQVFLALCLKIWVEHIGGEGYL